MTKEEAIRRMECCRNFLANNYSDMGEPNVTAFNMAIKALEQEPCGDAINRQATLAEFKRLYYDDKTVIRCAELVINGMPPANPQEPSGDLISRQELLEDLYKRDYTKFTHRDFVALVQYQDTVQQEPKTGHCKDCKWWKDSDGAFRRGIGAESKCPINREEVYEGNGYCFMFEPKERSDKE